MRIFLWFPLLFTIISGCASPPPLPPANIAKVEFVNEITISRPLAITSDLSGKIYAVQKDGTISVFSPMGELLSTLPVAVDRKGRPILKKPAAISVADDRIYLIDQSADEVVILASGGEFLDSFGRSGSNLKRFDSPEGIVVRDGIIYVADSGNSRIQVFDQSGVFLRVITGILTDDDPLRKEAKLRKPASIDLDYRGNIYVVDRGDDSVKIFSRMGDYLGKLPELIEPVGVSVANDGIYVADGKSYSVKKFTFDHRFDLVFGTRGKGRAQFAAMQAITSDLTGKIYVADLKKDLIHVFRAQQGEVFREWQKAPPITSVRWRRDIPVGSSKTSMRKGGDLWVADGRSISQIKADKTQQGLAGKDLKLISVAAAPDGTVWGVDGKKKRVVRVGEQGTIMMEFGNKGRGAGKFKEPVDIVISANGIIFVADPGNDMVHAFNNDGVFLNAFGEGAGGIKFAEPLAVDLSPDDTLYVLDGKLGQVFSFDANGKAIGSFGRQGPSKSLFAEPVDVAATGSEVFVLDKGRDTIYVFDRRGEMVRSFGSGGDGKGEFKDAEGLTGVGETVLYVSDTGNGRIQVLENIYIPDTPTGLVLAGGMRALTLNWPPAAESYVEKFRVRRSESESGDFADIADVADSQFVDRNVLPGHKYFYRISALTAAGNESRQSNVVSGEPTRFKPESPTGLKGTVKEWSVTLGWDPSKEDFVTGYNIYRDMAGKVEKVGETEEFSFIERGLSSNSTYTYLVAAVSSDGMESDRVQIELTTLLASKPPLGIDLVEMNNIFSNTYKKYEKEGVGRIRLTNNTGLSIGKIKVSFTIKEFMDFPADLEIDLLGPDESRELVLGAVFNNKILNITEDTPIQTEIKVSYYGDEKLQLFNRSFPTNVYEKHRMMWEDRRQFATFITPKDPVLLEFVRSVATQYPEGDFSMQRSAAVFGALGVLGLTYIPDPSNPYQININRVDFVDYIQYPQETLRRKSGDCDDLVALYSSALESLGMRTKVIEVPGHMLMMFSTGIAAGADADTMDGLFIIHDDQLWVAVETTMVGSSFLKAWEKGSETYYKWQGNGLSLLDIQEAWTDFKPASLQHGEWRPTFIDRKEIDERFNNEFSTLKRTGLRLKSRVYRERFAADSTDVDAVLQIGIIYGKLGETDDALEAFRKVLKIEPGHVSALNNIGNIHMIVGRLDEAATAYGKAVAVEPDDALLWVNLARCYVKSGKKDEARNAFSKARELDQTVVQKYRVLAIELMSAI